MSLKHSNPAVPSGRDIAPGVPAQKGSVMASVDPIAIAELEDAVDEAVEEAIDFGMSRTSAAQILRRIANQLEHGSGA